MKYAIGTDIVDIEKLRGSFARWGEKLLDRVLTRREYEYCRSKANFLQTVAGRIASKEAVYKALYQHGVSGLSWKDIEILDGPREAPAAYISAKAAERIPRAEITISISHTDKQAVAVALVERGEQ
jgi:holo-[acyl-carrier protein] synthase